MKENRILRLLCSLLLGTVLFQQVTLFRHNARLRALEDWMEAPAEVPGEAGDDFSTRLIQTAEAAQEANVIVNVYEAQTIRTYEDTFSDWEGTEKTIDGLIGQGSGVLLGEDLVLTCCHIAADRSRLGVSLPGGEELPAELVRADPIHDLALLKVPGIGGRKVFLGEGLALGEPVLCVGNPASHRLAGTVTFGIVSALDREMGAISDPKETVTVFQTDAPINGGTSGGGDYDLQGRLQGMVTRKYLGASGSDTQLEGIAMCIPNLQIAAFLNAH